MLHDTSRDTRTGGEPNAPAGGGQLARQEAIKQIERRRHFRIRATVGTLIMIILVVIWAFSEYHNAGGWPTSGFSQSSSIPNVWNYWIIYPALVWVLAMAADAWFVYGHKPVSESEIQREIERQAGQR
jgi:2TM domain-containing protein